jgi:transcriptional regulator with XRE-family HTH domain
MAFAEQIRDLRKAVTLTQQQLAVSLGLAVSSVARYESGTKPEPKVLVGLSRLAARAGRLDLATVFWDAALDELGDVGLENIAVIWSKAEAARVAHAAGTAVDFRGVLAEIQGLCVEINPGLGGEAARKGKPS